MNEISCRDFEEFLFNLTTLQRYATVIDGPLINLNFLINGELLRLSMDIPNHPFD